METGYTTDHGEPLRYVGEPGARGYRVAQVESGDWLVGHLDGDVFDYAIAYGRSARKSAERDCEALNGR